MFIKEDTQTVWITTDGKKHTEMDQAIKRQRVLNLYDWADSVGMCRGGEWDQGMVIDAIINDMDKFKDILLLDNYFEEKWCAIVKVTTAISERHQNQ